MRSTRTMSLAVQRVSYIAVSRAVDEPVIRNIGQVTVRNVDHVVDQAGYRAVSAVVLWAVYNDPPHSSLGGFLADADQGAP
jgi:hypothetical protein